MNKEVSAGGIVFGYDKTGSIQYLLIQSKTWKSWGFPKGHVEQDETIEETAIREIFEETSLNIKILKGFQEGYEYEFDFQEKHIRKEVIFFLAESENKEIKLTEKEHQSYCWLSYDEAMNLITHAEDKEILSKANDFLVKKDNY